MSAIGTLARKLLERVSPGVLRAILRRRLLMERFGPRMRSEPELRLLPVLVDRDAIAIDVGANLGNYSLLLSDLVADGRLHAFEPIPSVHARLCRLVPSACVHLRALSSHSGVSTLRVPSIGDHAVATRATLESGVTEVGQTGVTEINVTVTTLDDFAADLDRNRIGFIKIDVEGHERAVIKGAENVLAVHQPNLVIEVEQRHHAFPIQDVFEDLTRRGYQGMFVDVVGRSIRPLGEFNVAIHQRTDNHGSAGYVANFIFAPQMRYEETKLQLTSLLASFG